MQHYHFSELPKKTQAKILREFLTDKELLEGLSPLEQIRGCDVLFNKQGQVI